MRRFSLVYKLDITKNTLVDTLLKESRILSGIIRQIIVDIPTGWNYSAGFRIETDGQTEIRLPEISNDNNEKYFTGDETDFILNPNLKINESQIKIYGLNNDVVNDHSCIVTIEIEEDN